MNSSNGEKETIHKKKKKRKKWENKPKIILNYQIKK